VIRFVALLLAAAAVGIAAPPQAQASFPNCSAAKEAGFCDIPEGDPNYSADLDRDQDGIACEC
jgi:hypothetical protein